jgi:CelD/BcsL family acetyltransferase involved in cellulose biosynthesis
MTMEMFYGDQAVSLMTDDSFQEQWNRLYQDCLWATGFQNHFFVDAWYRLYATAYHPFLITSKTSDQKLDGLLPLAITRDEKELVVAGAWQADYHAWLSSPGKCAGFIMRALSMLADRFPGRDLVFKYLPPGLPIDWVKRAGHDHLLLELESIHRPFFDLKQTRMVDQSLRKKSNKSRMSRLKKEGELGFFRVHNVSELALHFDEIMDYYDLRQEGTWGSLAFRKDPLKKSFHLELMRRPDLLHATLLKVGHRVAAAHIGVCSDKTVHLGILAQSPFQARHSPGKIHMLLLSKMLREEGYEFFDLTPGGEFKDRFANTHDQVYVLRCFSDRTKLYKYRLKSRSRKTVRQVSRIVHLKTSKIRRFLSKLPGPDVLFHPKSFMVMVREKLWKKKELQIFVLDLGSINITPVERVARINCLDDLLKHVTDTACVGTKQFCAKALDLFARGHHCYTLTADHKLLYSCWLMKKGNIYFDNVHQEYTCQPEEVLLYDLAHFSNNDKGKNLLSFVKQIIVDISNSSETRRLVAAVQSNHTEAVDVYLKAGFLHQRSFYETVRFGKRYRWAENLIEAT